MYLLGVDGGSTKMDFAVADLSGKVLFEYRLYEPSNLKYVGHFEVIKNLQKGLEEIVKNGFDMERISSSYLGIAECGPDSGIKGRQEVFDFLENFGLKNFKLADDQYSVFYSLSTGKYGVLANAGTGSNINYFFEGGEKTYKSLGHGGRDFGKIILAQIKYGNIVKSSQIYKVIVKFLGQDPVDFYKSLSAKDYIINKQITQISKALFLEYSKNQALQVELDFLLVIVANRWASKITSYCLANFNFMSNDTFEIVLTGSMWKWQRVSDIVIEEILEVFPNAQILIDTGSKPVVGCLKLAKENL